MALLKYLVSKDGLEDLCLQRFHLVSSHKSTVKWQKPPIPAACYQNTVPKMLVQQSVCFVDIVLRHVLKLESMLLGMVQLLLFAQIF